MTTAPPPRSLQAIQDTYRVAVLRREQAAQDLLIRYYRPIQARLTSRLEAVLSDEDTPATLRRSARYRTLLGQLEAEMSELARVTGQQVITGQRAMVDLAQAHTSLQLTAVDATFNRLPTDALLDLVGSLQDGSPLRELIDGIAPAAAAAFDEALVTGLALGEGPRQVAARARRGLNVGAARALLISRTEITRSYRSSALRSYAENADVLRGWRWLSAKNMRTCALCWAMDGTTHALDEDFASHPACRCTPTPWLIDDDRKRETGAEAFERLTDAEQRAILGPTRLRLWNSGVPLADMVAETSTPRWGPGRRVRSVRELTS